LYEAMRRQLLPLPPLSEFTVALRDFVLTDVTFRCLRTAARPRPCRCARARDLVAAAFILAGTSKADEDEAIRRTSLRYGWELVPGPAVDLR
jgi:hypothetical protein